MRAHGRRKLTDGFKPIINILEDYFAATSNTKTEKDRLSPKKYGYEHRTDMTCS